MIENPVSKEFFEAKYLAEPDPWRFATSPYELERYSRTIETLGARRFCRAFEPGCSIGVLTERLARICDSVFAIDISSTALAQARKRCGAYSNITIREGSLPSDIPKGYFDLIVMSEIGYYFDEEALAGLTHRLVTHLIPGGLLLATHWLGNSPDHILAGDDVHRILRSNLDLKEISSRRYEGYAIDCRERR